jgi:hypothetical protein
MLLENALSPDDAQRAVNAGGLYKISGVERVDVKGMSLKEFLYKFIWEWERKFPTVYVKNGHVQTYSGRSRSITDMARIAPYYFPGTNVIHVRNAMLELSLEGSVGTSICHTILRRVFWQGRGRTDITVKDEFGWLFNKPQKRMPKLAPIGSKGFKE